MKRFQKICLLIAACFLTLGLVFCTIGWLLGADISDMTIWYDAETGRFYSAAQEKEEQLQQEFEAVYRGIEKLEVEIARADMQLIPGKGEYITVKAVNQGKGFVCEQSGKKLEIKESSRTNGMFHLPFGSGKEKTPHIVVEIPENLVFDQVELEVGVGSLKAENLSTEKFYGECGVGSLFFRGEILEKAELECGVGDIALEVHGKSEDFNYELETGIGEIKVGGSCYSGFGKEEKIRNNASKTMKLECGIGSIRADFTENEKERIK